MRNIRQQILFISLLPAMILVAVVAIYLLYTRLQDLETQFQTRGQSLARQLATASLNGLLSNKHDALLLLAQETRNTNPDVLGLRILDSHGLVLLRSGNKNLPVSSINNHFSSDISTANDIKAIYRYYPDQPVPKPVDGKLKLGEIELWLDSTPLIQEKKHIITTTLILTLIGLLITALLALFLSRRLAKPLEQLTQAARSLRAGKMGIRVPVTDSGEIGELQSAFNEMANEIAIASEHLHAQVDQATGELQESMEILEIKNVELDLARKRALEASRVKSEFLANMSHEIRTPMNGILGFTDLLRSTPLNQTQAEYLDTIKTSSHNLLTIINDILDLSKLEAGKLVLEKSTFSLRQCIYTAIALLAPMAHEKKLELVSLIYNDVPDCLLGDSTRVAQIITNLVSNAIKFTDEGEVVLRAMMESEDDHSITLSISVTDTGIGIPINEQDEIFSAFSQGRIFSEKTISGTGLGLSICKRLISEMNGSISLQSTPGKGSCFEFNIQLDKEDQCISSQETSSLFSGNNIWVVEPVHTSLLALRNMLSDLGVVCRELSDYATALTALRHREQPDLLIVAMSASSYMNPDHMEILSELIEQSVAPVLVLLGSSRQEDLYSILDLGAARCLGKPVKPVVLAQAISEILYAENTLAPDYSLDNTEVFSNLDMEGKVVLVADDNKANRQLIHSLLEARGAQIICVENGREAVDQISETHVDMAFIDIHMPVMDGFEAVERIRKLPGGESIPLIAMTADVMGNNQVEVRRNAFDICVTKPINVQELLLQISELEGKGEPGLSRENTVDHANEGTTESLVVYDPDKALRITGGSQTMADNLLSQLSGALPEAMEEIDLLARQQKWQELWQAIHKLQGMTALCAVPALSHALHRLQLAAENRNPSECSNRLDEAQSCANDLLNTYAD
ncbi:response regulator [Thiolapillus brandeum]|uniref:histidine kinase n=1 Tax=Thiolapillus brandeum TaxID=1076588 RepID=A0A7U6JH88_9GAMM|nr:response regulator [Thiolapillus brandeum]BAO44061.1 two-component system NarL family sensor histidine kinase BarA [Thiolapillus brandeum]